MAAKHRLNFFQRLGDGSRYSLPSRAGTTIYSHTIVGVTADGYAVPARKPDAVAAIGVAVNDTGDGRNIEVMTGVFNLAAAFADEPVPADIRKPVFALDDDAVSLKADASSFPFGFIEAIDEEGVWVRI